MSYLFQQGVYIFRLRFFSRVYGIMRKYWYTLLGMHIGAKSVLPKLYITWPHQVSIGNSCVLEHDICFKFSGIWREGPSIIIRDEVFIGAGCEFNIQKGITIGKYSNIASGCRFIDHDHGTKAGQLIGPQKGPEKEIILGEDVWLGCNVIVLKGVIIGDGAIVGAGSVVNKSVPANEIWAGVPARKLSERK